MDELKEIKGLLSGMILEKLNDSSKVKTEELGQVMDMLKDVSMTMYYCSIVKAMEDKTYDVSLSEKMLVNK